MRPTDAIDLIGRLLRERGVAVEEERGGLTGAGGDARAAWEAFCAMAAEPAGDPIEHYGETVRVGDDPDCDLLLHESGAQGGSFWISFTRQFSFENERRDYAGMNAVTLEIRCGGVPEGRVPYAQRWGYAGPRRPGVDDEDHPEIGSWAGHLERWRAAVEASRSFRVLDDLPPSRFVVSQSDI